jgi:hypothetical protein
LLNGSCKTNKYKKKKKVKCIIESTTWSCKWRRKRRDSCWWVWRIKNLCRLKNENENEINYKELENTKHL